MVRHPKNIEYPILKGGGVRCAKFNTNFLVVNVHTKQIGCIFPVALLYGCVGNTRHTRPTTLGQLQY